MEKGDVKRQFFIAVFPPEHIKEELRENVENYRPEAADDWVWKNPVDYHISLAFPGRLNEEELEAVVKALQKVEAKAFPVSFTGLGWFEREENKSGTNTHVVWVSPDNKAKQGFRELFTEIKKALRDAGYDYGRDDLEAHITITKPPIKHGYLAEQFMAAHNSMRTQSWRCDHFAIYQSLNENDDDHPANNGGEGSRYLKVAEFRLK